MNALANPKSRPELHCGAVRDLRVMSGLSAPQTLAAGSARPQRRYRVSLYIGEVAASREPAVLETLLGSCVAVCLYDPVLRAGGMNHILLPRCRLGDKNPRCGIHAMELLINELMKIGADRRILWPRRLAAPTYSRGSRCRKSEMKMQDLRASSLPRSGYLLSPSGWEGLTRSTCTTKPTLARPLCIRWMDRVCPRSSWLNALIGSRRLTVESLSGKFGCIDGNQKDWIGLSPSGRGSIRSAG